MARTVNNGYGVLSTFLATAVFGFLMLSVPVGYSLLKLGGSNFLWFGLAAFAVLFLWKGRRF